MDIRHMAVISLIPTAHLSDLLMITVLRVYWK